MFIKVLYLVLDKHLPAVCSLCLLDVGKEGREQKKELCRELWVMWKLWPDGG